jgi:hypothetical protein
LARSVGFGPVWSAPYTARMEQLSRPPATNQSARACEPIQERKTNQIPHARLLPRIWKQRGGHTGSRYLADKDQVSKVLLHALNTLPNIPSSVSQAPRVMSLVTINAVVGVQDLTTVSHDARDRGLDELQRHYGGHFTATSGVRAPPAN